MGHEIVFLLGADVDFLEIFGERGDRFYAGVDEALGLLVKNPYLGPLRTEGFRRLLIADSPFGIFYSVAGERIFVAAIIDLRKNPEHILQKLRSRR